MKLNVFMAHLVQCLNTAVLVHIHNVIATLMGDPFRSPLNAVICQSDLATPTRVVTTQPYCKVDA